MEFDLGNGMFVQIDSSVHIRLEEDMVNILSAQQWVTKEYPIGEEMYISINSPWKWIHIYPWYEGMSRLNRKVISLTFSQWKALVEINVSS